MGKKRKANTDIAAATLARKSKAKDEKKVVKEREPELEQESGSESELEIDSEEILEEQVVDSDADSQGDEDEELQEDDDEEDEEDEEEDADNDEAPELVPVKKNKKSQQKKSKDEKEVKPSKAKAAHNNERQINAGPSKNKTRVLVFGTRGIVARHRHLMEDIRLLLPHSKKEPKLDAKDRLSMANEVAELRNCDTVLLFEGRKLMDLYMWIAKTPDGPSIKFHVVNIHTMAELKFTGNNLLYSRAILSFDPVFESSDQMKIIKQMLAQVFTVPKGHRKSKPFVDHIISFFFLDGRIWIRHYQVIEKGRIQNSAESNLVEIGPRLVLTPIRIFSGSFQGATLWENQDFVHPNEIRRAVKRRHESSYEIRKQSKQSKVERDAKFVQEPDPLEIMFK
mmetsp:Transcript_15222/g.26580  ORF Transcript_15222/g.26580 Transcript_15222/m.26580 type:complete len:395 (-) Transcript_15222:148-1332(-)|eukprot:CAMPEP_0184692598 /NCGR_PEP_ID=MMETSP0313-20130426/1013_1 /TAXON_ID=2792 /ORGANISM="Porphyridium aerugineum, Strain SAG 1380-2" /LENGTH=394 /DNA_ID=CAMNT_0027150439 /DNA_START=1550 /DNA_END=2734 /DNA_ORIENTATION=+